MSDKFFSRIFLSYLRFRNIFFLHFDVFLHVMLFIVWRGRHNPTRNFLSLLFFILLFWLFNFISYIIFHVSFLNLTWTYNKIIEASAATVQVLVMTVLICENTVFVFWLGARSDPTSSEVEFTTINASQWTFEVQRPFREVVSFYIVFLRLCECLNPLHYWVCWRVECQTYG